MGDDDYSMRTKLLERRLRGFARNITGTAAFDLENFTDRDVDFFLTRRDSARSYWEEYRQTYAEWEELAVEANKDDFPGDRWQAQYDRLQLELVKADANLRGIENTLRARERANTTPAAPLDANTTPAAPLDVNTTHNVTFSAVKPHLPEIPIPSFSGDLLKWSRFRDTYVSLIHDEDSLSDIQKFHYLIGALEGEAAALISNFTINEASYQQAWSKIKANYDNPRILASLLVQRIMEYDVSTCRSELQQLETFLTGVADSIEAFKALKLEKPTDFLLASLALRALDPTTRKHFELSLVSSKDLPTADNVIEFVRQRKTALKMSHDLGIKSSAASSSRSSKPSHVSKRSVAFHLSGDEQSRHSTSSKSSNERSPDSRNSQQRKSSPPRQSSPSACPLCKDFHLLYQCPDFHKLSTAKRTDAVQRFNLCFNCLCRGHRVATCHSRFRCKPCGKRHHTLIHASPEPATIQKPSTDVSTASSNSFTGFGSASIPPQSKTTVLLGTVRLLIKSHRGDYHVARAVLDSGSQHSFITASLARKLGANVASFQGTITSFGESAVPQSVLKGTTSCTLRPCVGDQVCCVKFNPLVGDHITSSLPSCALPHAVIQKLSNHPLADHQFGVPGPIDLLIGAYLYSNIISGAAFHTTDLFFHPTIFGLMVTGSLHGSRSRASQSFFLCTSIGYPYAASCNPCDSYFDDIVNEADTTEDASQLVDQPIGGLDSGKWASSASRILSSTLSNGIVPLQPPESDFLYTTSKFPMINLARRLMLSLGPNSPKVP